MSDHEKFKNSLDGYFRFKFLKEIKEIFQDMAAEKGLTSTVDFQLGASWEVVTKNFHSYTAYGHAIQEETEKIVSIDADVLGRFVFEDKELKWPWPVRIRFDDDSFDKKHMADIFEQVVRSLGDGPLAWSKTMTVSQEANELQEKREESFKQELGERISRIADVLETMGFKSKTALKLVQEAIVKDLKATDDEVLENIMNQEIDQK